MASTISRFPSYFWRILVVGVACTAGSAGCSNEFLTSYQGERFSPPTTPTSVLTRPPNAGLIGSSNFVSAGGYGEPEAVSAASEVGADFVQWSRGLDSGDQPAGAGVVKASLSPTGPVSAWAPVQPGGFLYRYVARYYKSGVKDSPLASEAPRLSTGGTSNSAKDSQLMEDDQAATATPK